MILDIFPPLLTLDSSETSICSIFSSCSLIKLNFSAAVISLLAVLTACEFSSSWLTVDFEHSSSRLGVSLDASRLILALGGGYSGESWMSPVISLSLWAGAFLSKLSDLWFKQERKASLVILKCESCSVFHWGHKVTCRGIGAMIEGDIWDSLNIIGSSTSSHTVSSLSSIAITKCPSILAALSKLEFFKNLQNF